MNKPFRPLLSPNESPQTRPTFFEEQEYPLLVSPKLDGIRATCRDRTLLSRTGKPIPSYQAQEEFSKIEFLDGELIEGNETDFDVYNRTQSHIMSADKPGDLSYRVFDFTHPDWLDKPFYERLEHATSLINASNIPNVSSVFHSEVNNYDELIEYEDAQLELGYEGIMMRSPVGRYKQGRATFKEGIIYKLKRFTDLEGLVVGFEEAFTNINEQERDELGYAKRSSSKAGRIPANTLGKFIVLWGNIEVRVSPGNFNHQQRKEIWDNREHHLHKYLKYRTFTHGTKDIPRHARALGFRDPMDFNIKVTK